MSDVLWSIFFKFLSSALIVDDDDNHIMFYLQELSTHTNSGASLLFTVKYSAESEKDRELAEINDRRLNSPSIQLAVNTSGLKREYPRIMKAGHRRNTTMHLISLDVYVLLNFVLEVGLTHQQATQVQTLILLLLSPVMGYFTCYLLDNLFGMIKACSRTIL